MLGQRGIMVWKNTFSLQNTYFFLQKYIFFHPGYILFFKKYIFSLQGKTFFPPKIHIFPGSEKGCACQGLMWLMHFQAPGREPRRKNRFLSPLLLWPQKKWENVERQSAISIANLAMLREFCKGSRAVYSKFILSSLNMMEWNGEALNMRHFFWIQTFAKLFESSFHQN